AIARAARARAVELRLVIAGDEPVGLAAIGDAVRLEPALEIEARGAVARLRQRGAGVLPLHPELGAAFAQRRQRGGGIVVAPAGNIGKRNRLEDEFGRLRLLWLLGRASGQSEDQRKDDGARAANAASRSQPGSSWDPWRACCARR